MLLRLQHIVKSRNLGDMPALELGTEDAYSPRAGGQLSLAILESHAIKHG